MIFYSCKILIPNIDSLIIYFNNYILLNTKYIKIGTISNIIGKHKKFAYSFFDENIYNIKMIEMLFFEYICNTKF